MKVFFTFWFSLIFSISIAQYWQQEITYNMTIDMDVQNHRFNGVQNISYVNNSPDTLYHIYYHLYYNAFQPGSMMDMRSRNIPDPDRRIGNRISELKENEIGFHKVISLRQSGEELKHEVNGTILMVDLHSPIAPGSKEEFEMTFESQIPVQIRRTGRNNIEGIDYSMSQWYPKLCEYDREGWHTTQYVAREFHGVWGEFNVEIKIDSSYTLAGTGVLTNPEEIGHGYAKRKEEYDNAKLSWKFKADRVHDFVWAADRDYLHTSTKTANGTVLRFFYQNDTAIVNNWEILPSKTVTCFEYMEEMVGEYPYPEYQVIQAGDGGMEYPMATLILGNGKLNGLISVMIHESVHSWFQGVLANNEGSYAWMDEGFNTYFDHLVKDSIFERNSDFPHKGSYLSYYRLLEMNRYEAISLHADHYAYNRAYGVAAYSMGCIFLNQLQYIIGEQAFERTIHSYYTLWKFKHPSPTDFKKVAEKMSGMDLDWYFNYFIHTTKTIDYSVDAVKKADKNSTNVHLSKKGDFPMPIDVYVSMKNGEVKYYTLPLRMMLYPKMLDGEKRFEKYPYWQWTNNEYQLTVPVRKKDIEKVEIDPSRRMADIDLSNNIYPAPKEKKD